MRQFTLLAIFLSAQFASAHGSKRGFWILSNLPAQNLRAHKAGDTPTLEGKICYAKISSNRIKCDNFDDDKIDVKAYFPDEVTEVTSDLTIQKRNGSFEYKYKTKPLNPSAPNALTIVVGKLDHRSQILLKTKAKTEKRIAHFRERLEDLGTHPKHEKRRKVLRSYIEAYEKYLVYISKWIKENPTILAQMSQPIQVDNKISTPLIHSSIFEKIKISTNVALGAPIDGESTPVKTEITFLEDRRNSFSDDDIFAVNYYLNDELVASQPQIEAEPNQPVMFEFVLNNLKANKSNLLEIEVTKIEERDHRGRGRWDWFRDWLENWRHGGGWGSGGSRNPETLASLQQYIIVAPDVATPLWGGEISPATTIQYAQNFPPIYAEAADAFGRLKTSNFKLKIGGQDFSSKLDFVSEDFGRKIKVSADPNPVNEGLQTMELRGTDFAGNYALPNPLVRTIRIDRTAPEVLILTADNQITNFNQVNLRFKVLDSSPVTAEIYLNSNKIESISHDGQGSEVSRFLMLSEGPNQIEVRSKDEAGNHGLNKLVIITLDTVAPMLTNFSPANNAIINSLNVKVTGRANERLSAITANGEAVGFDNGTLNFEWNHAALSQGNLQATFLATDLAGNQAEQILNYQIVLEPLIQALITIEPLEDGRIVVRGAAGASVPGVEITANGGLFNKATVVSNADGSFAIILNRTSSVSVTATANGITKTVALNVNVNTTLSGIVKNSLTGNPLMGVRVSVDGGQGLFVTTDANGVFSIQNVPTGDRVVHFDGSQIPEELRGPNNKFFTTKVALNIGVNQTNVLENAVYLTPLVTDGTQTQVIASQTTTVTSPHAPGVSMTIPANAATFPDGTKTGTISMAVIDAERTSVPPLDFVMPENVIALEPSGLKFSQPIQLTVPNDNEILPGVQVVFLSKNSDKGIWEIDGVGRVSQDGLSITTEPGQGITHFSEVYAAPLGPKVGPVGAQDQPGADTFNGALTTQLKLPGFLSLGETVTPQLIYKSSWANPAVAVTSVIDIPRNEVQLSPVTQGKRNLLVSASVEVTGRAWVEPEYIDTQFITEDLISEKLRLKGMPNKSVISYGIDLGTLSSGVHPYSNRFEIKLKQMIVGTRTIRTRNFLGRKNTRQESFSETRSIEQIYPQDSAGQIFTLNKINSEAGRGWKFAGIPSLHNLSGPRVSLEGGDGSVVSYGLDNTIETVHNAGTSELKAVDLSQWPLITYVDQANSMKRVSLADPENPIVTSISVERPSNAGFFEDIGMDFNTIFGLTTGSCRHVRFDLSFPRDVRGILEDGTSGQYGVDMTGAIFRRDAQGVRTITSLGNTLPYNIVGDLGPSSCHGTAANCPGNNFCRRADLSKRGTCSLTSAFFVNFTNQSGFGIQIVNLFPSNPVAALAGTPCQGQKSAQIEYPLIGAQDGPAAQALFNDPVNITKGFGNNIIIVDQGNNKIRSMNIADNSVTTIAGNGQNFDLGDGGAALAASMFHPLAAVYDSAGNLYIATERGFIRRVDSRGIITRFAGKSPAEGGVLKDQAPAEDMIFSRPAGLAIDNSGGYLYVADTGQHRVVQIDLITKNAIVVAGNGSCQATVIDGVAALNSSLCNPEDVGVDSDGNLLIGDTGHKRIRRVNFNRSTDGTTRYLSSRDDQSTLLQQANGQFVLSTRGGSQTQFDETGKHVSTILKSGKATYSEYDPSGRLIVVRDSVGQKLELTYLGNVLHTMKDPANRITTFEYTGKNLTKVTFPDGNTKKFAYNSFGLMTSETDERNNSIEYTYNSHHRLLTAKGPDGAVVAMNDSTSATIANNFTGGNVGQLKSYGTGPGEVYDGIVDARSLETKFIRDTNGFVTKVVDATGATTEVTRDATGRILKTIRPDGSIVEYEYDPVTHDILKMTDSSTGRITEMTYDQFGNRTLEKIGNLRQEFTYDPVKNLLTSTKGPAGNVTNYAHNALGLVSKVTKQISASVNHVQDYDYDNLGRLTKETSTGGIESSYILDLAGNVISATEVKGPSDSFTKTFSYDKFNRLLTVTSPRNEVTTYRYLPTGQLREIENPRGQITSLSVDAMGRVTQKTDFAGRVYQYGYDNAGNLTRITEPGSRIKTFEYDNLNRISIQNFPDDKFEFDYDIRGNLISAKNKNSLVEYGVDNNGRVDTVTTKGLGEMAGYPQVTIDYEFNAFDQRTKMTDSLGGVVNYDYFANARLQNVRNHKSETFSYEYNLIGQISKITRPGGLTEFTYANSLVPQSIKHKRGAIVDRFFDYSYNSANMVTSITSGDGAEIVGYDSNKMLSNFSQPVSRMPASQQGLASETFTYDTLFNRLQNSEGTIDYDPTGQLIVSDFKNRYFHDSQGNVFLKEDKATGKVVRYDYSSQNQLTKVSYLPSLSSTAPYKVVVYAYDASGRRMYKNVVDNDAPTDKRKTFTRYFVHDGSEILVETDENKSVLARYTHSTLKMDDVLSVDITTAGVQAQIASSAGTFTFLKDAIGTVRSIANASGQIVQNYSYSAYGQILSIKDSAGNDITSSPTIFTASTFTGREIDWETGLYYFRARHYDPSLGRFLQRDPHPGSMLAPRTVVNSYSYAGNNPVAFTDPTGNFFFAIPVLIGLAGVGIGAAVGYTGAALIAWAVLDPMSFFSGILLVGEVVLSPVNLILYGRLPEFSFVGGYGGIGVRNSVWGNLGGSVGMSGAFSTGAAFFAHNDADEETIRHEAGHVLQWQDYGGWGYVRLVLDSVIGTGPQADYLEESADVRATEYFGILTCIYRNPTHQDPRCRN